jgi:hypothetical protein
MQLVMARIGVNQCPTMSPERIWWLQNKLCKILYLAGGLKIRNALVEFFCGL